MQIVGTNIDDTLTGTISRDKFFGDLGADTFELRRDGKKDHILDFNPSDDQIDLTQFNVTWDDVQIKQQDDDSFKITIRGEDTLIFMSPEDSGAGDDYDVYSLTESHFIFNPGAGDVGPTIILDGSGINTLVGTDQQDYFVMQPDTNRDVITNFDITKDKVDLSAHGITFYDLELSLMRVGRVKIEFNDEKIILRDISKRLEVDDVIEAFFIF